MFMDFKQFQNITAILLPIQKYQFPSLVVSFAGVTLGEHCVIMQRMTAHMTISQAKKDSLKA